MKLKDLGFDDWFKKKTELSNGDDLKPARVIAVDKNRFIIRNEDADTAADLSGKLVYSASSGTDFPAVGDWVNVRYFDQGSFAVIYEILPRKSLLKRKTPGDRIEEQLIAANIDAAFIIQSLDNDFNISRLERYLMIVNDSNIEPVVLLSKTDLVADEIINTKILSIRNVLPAYEIIAFSNKTGRGIDEINSRIMPAKTYCLIGSSGVGKTSLLNHLTEDLTFYTGEVREKDGKGRHVTTRRQLVILKNGGILIDTPGMRELAGVETFAGLDKTFMDIKIISGNCRFKDCTHTSEPGCAVKEAVKSGKIDENHYKNYLKLCRELERNSMSRIDKRKKDRALGKKIRQIIEYKGKK